MPVNKTATAKLTNAGFPHLQVVKSSGGFRVDDKRLQRQSWHAMRNTAAECVTDVLQKGIVPQDASADAKATMPVPGPYSFRYAGSPETGVFIDCDNWTGPMLRGGRSCLAGTICTVGPQGLGGYSPVATARLIAASWNLLRHLKASVWYWEANLPTDAGPTELDDLAAAKKAIFDAENGDE